MKCHAKKDMRDPKSITMKYGKPTTQGTCLACGTKMLRTGKSQALVPIQNKKIGLDISVIGIIGVSGLSSLCKIGISHRLISEIMY